MPYIKDVDRAKFVYALMEVPEISSAGELNYLFTRLAQDYLNDAGLSYTTINDVVGALEGAKLEFYRRVAAPYEDRKIQENGDVY